MPTIFWGEAVLTAMSTSSIARHVLNHWPTKALNGRTLYEAWHGHKMYISYLCIFDCLAFMTALNHVGKLDDRRTTGVYIDYADWVKVYHILYPVMPCVCTTHNVVFDEGWGWVWSSAARPRCSLTSLSSTSTSTGLEERTTLL